MPRNPLGRRCGAPPSGWPPAFLDGGGDLVGAFVGVAVQAVPAAEALPWHGIVRECRTFVHLRKQRERGVVPDRDTLGLCWGPVRAVLAVLNDLETSC
ncbi:hypothetical protein [Streptomyces sp. NPDC048419]|uniref:hypothetical protein n=1 Tax=Streptomyces sp. NPDC048419 TaxID=3365547 RepID=UPI003722D34B